MTDGVGMQLVAALQDLAAEVRTLRKLISRSDAHRNDPTDETLLTLNQLARFADVSRRTLDKYVRRDHDPLPAHRRPGDRAYIVRWGAYKAWLASQSEASDIDAQAIAIDVVRNLTTRR